MTMTSRRSQPQAFNALVRASTLLFADCY